MLLSGLTVEISATLFRVECEPIMELNINVVLHLQEHFQYFVPALIFYIVPYILLWFIAACKCVNCRTGVWNLDLS